MKIHKTAILLAFLSACSPGDAPVGAEQQQPAPAEQAPVQGPTLDMTGGKAAPTPAGETEAPQKELTPAEAKFKEALDLIGKGDAAGTLRILEELRRQNQATKPMLSLLGAVYLQENRAKDA
ncbi:MAG TPA: hypothetical protein VFR31_02810, partial [Thermoanaerobaculia bacterium]|nr:hypothetical protein [Thermoanaerobaculia bacterium]